MDLYLFLKVLHVLGAAVLFGTGLGIAFFMAMAHRTRDPGLVAHVGGTVVVADGVFTATAVLAQPLTGLALMHVGGFGPEPWMLASIALYLVAGAFWLPVVRFQIRLRNLARHAHGAGEPLPRAYHRLFRVWFAFGFPAFGAVLAIFFLMVFKPALW